MTAEAEVMNGMVSCKSCLAHNSLDSTFCKKCGATLPADDLKQAKDKLEAVIADGFKVFSAGRTSEAMQVAETAVLANPSSTAALSLKAMCHERLGQVAEALECHERVLEIDPDSMLDKIKVNDLKNLLVARTSIAAIPDRRNAIITAVAAFVLIISIGVVLARGSGRSSDGPTTSQPIANLQPKGSVFDPPATVANPGPPQGQQGTGQPAGGAPNPTETNKTPGTPERHVADDPGKVLPAPSGDGRLPKPDDGTSPVRVSIENPDQLRGGPTNTVATHPSVASSTGPKDPDPVTTVVDPGTQNNPARQNDPGIMDIQVTSGKGKSGSDSSDPATHPNGVQALLRTARSQYQISNYSAAATSYERALRAGANPASANQRLAECYEKLGRSSEAVAAYNRAIDALKADIDGGRGDKARLSNALDVCKQAVKVLGG